MGNFYIKRVTALGKNKKDAVVEFTHGLNIIFGLSDTGKSCVLNCIDFIFCSDDLPFDENLTGYSSVRVLIESSSGSLTLERTLGKNKITVSGNIEDIDNGTYDAKYSARSKHTPISGVFLSLIGIKEPYELIKNKDFAKDRLTWRTFLHTFLIAQENVYKKESILLPERKEANTLFLSSLVFLLTGQDFARFDKQEESRIRNAKKSELIKHINSELSGLAERKEKLEEQLLTFGQVEIGEKIRAIIADVSAIKARIEQANERGKSLFGEIITAREELTDCDLLRNRYTALRNHFIADIKRLTLIVDGETVMESVPNLDKCPICDGEVKETDKIDYTEASRSELTRIISQLDGLAQVENDVNNRRAEVVKRIAMLDADKIDIDNLINSELKPQEHELSKILADYQAAMKIQGELDFIERFANEKTYELREKEKPEKSNIEYRPKEHLDSNFRTAIDEYLQNIFTKCCFENLLTAHFDIESKFDVSINGAVKATSRGQGYRAFINTVLALTFRKYLIDNGKYYPGLFFVDSPLQSLYQGSDEKATDNMKVALFKYLFEAQSDGQIIVIENEIPDLDYKTYNVNPIHFTGGKSDGRYGFLYLDNQY